MPSDTIPFISPDSLLIQGAVDSSSLARVDSMWYDTLPAAEPIRAFLAQGNGGMQLPEGKGLGEVMVRFAVSYDWVFWVFFAGVLLVTMMRFAFPRRFHQVLGALLVERSLVNMLREGDLFTERIMLGMMAVFCSLTGMFLLVLTNASGISDTILPSGFKGWAVFTLAVLAWWLLRSLLIWLLGFIFRTFDATSLYLSRILSMNMGIGVVLLALLPLSWYGNFQWINSLLLWIFLGANLYRIVRSMADGLRMTGFGMSYLLLFALSVEAVPLVLMAGFFRHNIL